MSQFLHVGSLDGGAIVEMNNVAVGYLTSYASETCMYVPLVPVQVVSIDPFPAQPESAVKPAIEHHSSL